MAKKLGGLGKGLGAIFIENDNEENGGAVKLKISMTAPKNKIKVPSALMIAQSAMRLLCFIFVMCVFLYIKRKKLCKTGMLPLAIKIAKEGLKPCRSAVFCHACAFGMRACRVSAAAVHRLLFLT